MNLDNQLKLAINTIQEASKIVISIYNGDFIINKKEDTSYVTNADIASNNYICKQLLDQYPDYGLLSEESKDNLSRINKDFCWIVDPLDGTRDFVGKTGNFAINIALSYKNEIILGVIAIPVKNIIYYATKGNGAYKIENNQINKIEVSKKEKDLTMLVSQFFFHDNDHYNKLPFVKEIITCGSSYKAGLIAEGKGEFCIKFDDKTKEWDTAPSDIIIKEAHGLMTDMYGNKMFYNKKDYVNHNGFIIANNQQVLDLIKKSSEIK